KRARGVALAVLAVALMGSNAAVAADEAPAVVAPTSSATPTRGLVPASAAVEPDAGPVLPSAKEPAKVERSALRTRRVRRDEDRVRRDDYSPRLREASVERARGRYEGASIPWHRSGGGVGLILGVGY